MKKAEMDMQTVIRRSPRSPAARKFRALADELEEILDTEGV